MGQEGGEPSNGFSSFSHVQPGWKMACIPVVPSVIVIMLMPPACFMSSLSSGVSKRRTWIVEAMVQPPCANERNAQARKYPLRLERKPERQGSAMGRKQIQGSAKSDERSAMLRPSPSTKHLSRNAKT